MTIGELIKTFRKKAGYTQKQLAKICGVAEITIRQYELNKREPRQEQLRKIADALNVTLFELMGYGGSIYVESSPELEYNRIIDKQREGDGFTPYDIRYISDYIKENSRIREWFVVNGLKSQEKCLHDIQNAYEHLNNEGRKEAAKRVAELTEISHYTEPEEWFRGGMTKEEIDEALKAYLNEDNIDDPPQD